MKAKVYSEEAKVLVKGLLACEREMTEEARGLLKTARAKARRLAKASVETGLVNGGNPVWVNADALAALVGLDGMGEVCKSEGLVCMDLPSHGATLVKCIAKEAGGMEDPTGG